MIIPQTCLLCGQYHRNELSLCEGCEQDLPWLKAHCLRCANPLPIENSLCGECLGKNPTQQKTLAVFDYRFPITPLIQQLKNNRPLLLARLFGKLLAHAAQVAYEAEALPQALIPIPLHRKRLAQRGHNPSALIGAPLERQLKIPCLHSLVKRIKNTPPQKNLNHEQRQKNVRDAFDVQNIRELKTFGHIALIDDVVTTGATTQALAKLLKPHVERIDIWCIARTQSSN